MFVTKIQKNIWSNIYKAVFKKVVDLLAYGDAYQAQALVVIKYTKEDWTSGYRDILESSLIPSRDIFQADQNWLFQQDNAPCHTAHSITNYFVESNILLMPWPALKPNQKFLELDGLLTNKNAKKRTDKIVAWNTNQDDGKFYWINAEAIISRYQKHRGSYPILIYFH